MPTRAFRALTFGIVLASLLVSLLLPTVELALGLAGATAGVLVCVALPAVSFLRLTRGHTAERALAKVGVVLVALLLPTVQLALGLAGATAGVLVCVALPAVSFLRLTRGHTAERALAKVGVVLVALLLPTVQLALGLAGATAGVLVCVALPAVSFLRLTRGHTAERALAKVGVVLVALLLPTVQLALGLAGATAGVLVCVALPAVSFLRLTRGHTAERALAKVGVVLVALLLPTVQLALGLAGATAGVLVCVALPAVSFLRLTRGHTAERALAKVGVVLVALLLPTVQLALGLAGATAGVLVCVALPAVSFLRLTRGHTAERALAKVGVVLVALLLPTVQLALGLAGATAGVLVCVALPAVSFLRLTRGHTAERALAKVGVVLVALLLPTVQLALGLAGATAGVLVCVALPAVSFLRLTRGHTAERALAKVGVVLVALLLPTVQLALGLAGATAGVLVCVALPAVSFLRLTRGHTAERALAKVGVVLVALLLPTVQLALGLAGATAGVLVCVALPAVSFLRLTRGHTAERALAKVGVVLVALLLPTVQLALGLAGATAGVLVCVALPAVSFLRLTRGHTAERALAKVGVVLVALLLPTVQLALGLAGATAGVLVCVALPAVSFLRLTRGHTAERALAKCIVVLGLIILVLGTYANLRAAESSIDKYDERYITQERIDKIVEDFFEKMEKSEADGMIRNEKPQLSNDQDSKVQPPNPVPPESHSIEKNPSANIVNQKLIKEILQDQKDAADTLKSSTHPKNEKLKLADEIIANGDIGVSKKEPSKIEKANEEKPQSNQEKIDMMKQQQLIETIKQHGEEQKELIKEQKEILDEILKTKKELEKNKKEVVSNEAKKLAVESIQKIADVAIKSLSGVTDPPAVLKDVNQGDNINKYEHDAANEIAKKAKEALDVIKKLNKEKKEKEKAIFEEKHKDTNVKNGNENTINQVQQNLINTEEIKEREIQHRDNTDNQHGVQSNLNSNLNVNSQLKVNGKADKQNNPPSKDHSHLPDEPQSYKQGEDLQKKVDSKPNHQQENNIQRVPLPIALKEKVNSNKIADINNNLVQNNGAVNFKDDILQNIASGQKIIPRRKREVVDCTEKTTLNAEDRQICENLVNTPNIVSDETILKNVNLDEVDLSNSLPLQAMALHHIRSLKSIQDKKR
ncbi:uncharacterized protein LOC123659851 [Melitaea cinxia]|uniref:uncharacterized protein LOC123659851 n=1 Tax=Melitaea cinxia TaxID=113334 RepID=UPI001E26E90B|nr:uncharacterized protein LOC123659851 [Melitaea cinxia]